MDLPSFDLFIWRLCLGVCQFACNSPFRYIDPRHYPGRGGCVPLLPTHRLQVHLERRHLPLAQVDGVFRVHPTPGNCPPRCSLLLLLCLNLPALPDDYAHRLLPDVPVEGRIQVSCPRTHHFLCGRRHLPRLVLHLQVQTRVHHRL